jgi:RNA polymerase sigma-70 factor (ECF subfamily)
VGVNVFRRGAHDPDSARVRFDALLRTHHRALHAHVRVVYPGAEADAVVNAIFTRLWLHLDQVPDHAVRTWLRAAARHEVLNTARSERRWHALNDKVARLEASATIAPLDIDVMADLQLVLHALAGLTTSDRQILLMTALEDLSTDDLAEILGVRPNAVKVRLSRARARLRSAVLEQDQPVADGREP